MPFFDVFCDEHGEQEVWSRDSSSLDCPVCSRKARRLWSRPAVFRIDFTPGWDMGAGQNFYTKAERANWMREHSARQHERLPGVR